MSNFHIGAWEISSRQLLPTIPKFKNKLSPMSPPGCNCTGQMGPCPLQGQCLVRSVVYGAEVSDSNHDVLTYTGLTSNTFKQRFYKHRSSFLHESEEHETTLSSHIWDLKRKNLDFDIQWNIKDKAPPFNPVSRRCRLCLKEKYYIIFQPEGGPFEQEIRALQHLQAQIKRFTCQYLIWN